MTNQKRVLYAMKKLRDFITVFTILGLLAPSLAFVLPSVVSPVSAVAPKTYNDSEIHIKFAADAQVSLKGDQFESKTTSLTQLNALIGNNHAIKKSRLFQATPATLEHKRLMAQARTGKKSVDLNAYYQLTVSDVASAPALLEQLEKLPYITEAYFAPLAAPAPADYVASQTYRGDAPRGLGVDSVAALVGTLGNNVQISDIEYSWNTQHEDLSAARQPNTTISNGTASDPFTSTDHGTAVAGILSADQNGIGVNGIAPSARLRLVNAYNTERGWDVANAVLLAQTNSSPGDIILIEQQAFGIGSEYVPVEWVPAVYDAIKLATDSGIIVVEAAGNGGRNLDDPAYGTSFPQGKPDSGAIMVGSGSIACNAGIGGQAQRVRNVTSNYGARVNVQSWGSNVATTGGYGSGAPASNSAYTTVFNGTSSASALVAGAAAAISGHEKATTGTNVSSAALRNLLVTTGNPQDTRQNAGHVGPSPNLPRALGQPATPLSTPCLAASAISGPSVELAWDDTIDNVGAEFVIWRNGQILDTVSGTSAYSDDSVQLGANYSYAVSVRNNLGDTSALSNTVNVYTADVVPPTTPGNLVVTGKQTSSITVGWTASSDTYGVAGYDVYRNGIKVGTTTALSSTSSGLTPGTTYSFYVVAFDAAGNRSTPTNTITSTTLGDTTAPTTPTNLTGNGSVVGKVTLQWTASTDNVGISKYNIYRDSVLIGTSTTTSYTDTTVARKKTYVYQVKALDAANNMSAYSTSVTVKT
jgi:serine protease